MTTCERYRESVQELLDGTLGPIRRAELQLHLDQCDECRHFAEDMDRIRGLAGSLDRPAPPDRVWLQLAGQLRQEGRVRTTGAPAQASAHRRYALLAIAATLVLAVGASILYLAPRRGGSIGAGGAPAAGGNAAAADTVESVDAEVQLAEQHFQNAIGKLERIVASDPNAIDPETSAALRKSNEVVDQAIAESRAALRKEPQNAAAADSLLDALRRKVALLQDTIALMNEMRKGNSVGAAQIVEGVNKS